MPGIFCTRSPLDAWCSIPAVDASPLARRSLLQPCKLIRDHLMLSLQFRKCVAELLLFPPANAQPRQRSRTSPVSSPAANIIRHRQGNRRRWRREKLGGQGVEPPRQPVGGEASDRGGRALCPARAASCHKGYEDIVIQDLNLSPQVSDALSARALGRPQGESIIADLDPEIIGGYGCNLLACAGAAFLRASRL